MCGLWSVYSVNLLCEAKEPSVLHVIRRDVIVIVPSLSVIAEAVKVFNAQVQTLKERKEILIINKSVIKSTVFISWSVNYCYVERDVPLGTGKLFVFLAKTLCTQENKWCYKWWIFHKPG